ncbi:NAD-dependent epimerase/dehydratase family protein [Halorubrum ruber]|uniref:NAD-dependent epimerase/dehydratase family protein n=1 Tax=Halorubrum ruber TaxID=2982524 RepID=A0A8T8LIB6_9EURY|nr:NAD-dependent epimerase/dehydratase family protein [Halorubrum ruber]QUO46922.1 NAD-dependent epimerase/dehydratase family protein [Halorubrum ruber]
MTKGSALTVAVTGAAGYLGSCVVATLLDGGHNVLPVDNFSTGSVESIRGQAVKHIDVRDRRAVRDVIGNADAVIHLAAVSDVESCEETPEHAFDVNVVGTENVAWVCRQKGIPLSFAGSVAVFGEPESFPLRPELRRDPLNVYGSTKQMNEDDIHSLSSRKFPAHVFLMANLFGAHDEGDNGVIRKRTVIDLFIDAARANEPLKVYDPGTQARNFIHVKDAADAYLRSVEALVDAEDGATTYTLGSDQVLSVLELAELVQGIAEDELGHTPPIERVENPRDEAISERFAMETSPVTNELGFESYRTVEESIRQVLSE